MNFLHRGFLTLALSILAIPATCGDEIINGKKAKKNTLEFMASVQRDNKHACGGFLVDERFVLTAAHCNRSATNVSVILGTQDIDPRQANLKRFCVEEMIKHPSFESAEKGADIMLLKLSKKVELGKGIKLIKFPPKNTIVKPNTKCQVAGWGKTEKARNNNNLLVTDVSTVDLKVCEEQWKKEKIALPQKILCAGGYKTKSGACQGDSGGPLVCKGLAVGIVSFNLKGNCNYPNVSNVYTQISNYSDWIMKVIKNGE